VMSSEEAIHTVREIYESGETDMKLIAEELIDLALNKGSKDNISAIVVKLSGAMIGPAENGGVLGRRRYRQGGSATSTSFDSSLAPPPTDIDSDAK
jgi:serine/threonine protein phosphatase PrpC